MSENRGFIKHFTIIGMGTFLNMVLGVFSTPIITRIVEPADYGQLSLFTMYSSLALMVLCMGLDQALVRYYYEKETEDYKRALLFKCIKLPVIISIVISVMLTLISMNGINVLDFPTYIVVLLCVYTITQIIYRFSVLVVRLAYKSKLYSTLNILVKLTYIIFALLLLFFIKANDLLALVIATLLSGFVGLMVSILAQKNLWNVTKNNGNCCHISVSELIKYAYPFIFSMGITTLFQSLDKISLSMYCTYEDVGIYSSTVTLVNVFAIIQTTFNSLWGPMSVEHYAKEPEDKSFYQNGNQIITVIMFFIGFSLIFAKDIFAILLGEKYREAAYILPFLIFNPIMYTISETTVSGLVFKKKSKLQVVVAIGACLTNFIGNTILVPELGCQGAAISTGISYIVFFSLRTYFSNKYFYVDFKLKKLYILTGVAVLYAFYNTFIEFNVGTMIGYLVGIMVLVFLYFDTIKMMAKYVWGYVNKKVNK